ncbi:MAG: PAS domain S-box protein [Pseudomonadota bacterium]
MDFKNISFTPLTKENREMVVSLILGYDLLYHQDIKTAFYSKISSHSNQLNVRLGRGNWDIVLILCEAYLTNTSNVVSDICSISPLSESTTRRTLRKLQSLEIIERFVDQSDLRRQFIGLKKTYKLVIEQFICKCSKDFEDLIELSDKREHLATEKAKYITEKKLQFAFDSIPALISYIDCNQCYVFNNKKYQEWFGYNTKELKGKHVRDIIGLKAYKILQPYIKKVLAGKQVNFELKVPYKKINSDCYILAHYIPDIANNGDVVGFIAHTIDITKQKENQIKRQKNDLKFKLLTESITDAFWMSTWDLTEIIYISPAYENIWGQTREILYKYPHSFLDAIHPDDIKRYLIILDAKHKFGQAYEHQYRIILKNGNVRWINEKGYPITEAWDKKQLMARICTDISKQKLMEQKLRNSEYKFTHLIESLPIGVYETDAKGAYLYVNKTWQKHAGLDFDEVLGENWQMALYKEDIDRVYQLWEKQSLNLKPWQMQYRYSTPEGKITKLHGTAVALRNPDGEITGYLGANIDITKLQVCSAPLRNYCASQKADINTLPYKTEPILHSAYFTKLLKQNELILSFIGEGVIGIDMKGCITYVNPAAKKMIGWDEEDLIGKQQLKIIHHSRADGSHYSKEECLIHASLMDGLTRRVDNEIFWRMDGSSFPVEYICTPVIVKDKLEGAVVSFQDITEQKLEQQKIKFLATHDILTGLPNRNLLMEHLKQAVSRAQRYQHKLALLFIDLDGFKLINDTMGHDIGDIVLMRTAKSIQECLREIDSVSRFGGDEFVAVLEDISSPEIASKVATKILSKIAQPISIQDSNIKIGASIGISLYPLHGFESEKLLKAADKAMYYAKQSGKGNFHLAS